MTLLPLLGRRDQSLLAEPLVASPLMPSVKFTNTEKGSHCDWVLVSQLLVLEPTANEQEITTTAVYT